MFNGTLLNVALLVGLIMAVVGFLLGVAFFIYLFRDITKRK